MFKIGDKIQTILGDRGEIVGQWDAETYKVRLFNWDPAEIQRMGGQSQAFTLLHQTFLSKIDEK